jgi:hypothetical protein
VLFWGASHGQSSSLGLAVVMNWRQAQVGILVVAAIGGQGGVATRTTDI